MQQQGMSQLFGKDLTDPALKSVANALAQHHRTQFANLFTYLNSH